MNNYILFMKLKRNEIAAVSVLSSEIKNNFSFLGDFPQNKGGYSEEKFIIAAKRLVRSFEINLSDVNEFYLDNFDIDSDLVINGMDSYAYLLGEFSNFPVIPVVGVDRSHEHIDSVINAKKEGIIQSKNIALRLTQDDFSSYQIASEDINNILGEVINMFENGVDLIFDCRICLNHNAIHIANNIANFVQEFYQKYPLNKVIVTGSSIPASISELTSTDSEMTIQRNELEIYNLVAKLLDIKTFNLFLGDYGIVSPNYSTIDVPPETMNNIMSAKIIYSYDNNQLILRGGAIRSRGQDQYYDLAEILISRDYYRGAGYSWGDNFLEQKSRRVEPRVMPGTIIKPALNAHITYMFQDYTYN